MGPSRCPFTGLSFGGGGETDGGNMLQKLEPSAVSPATAGAQAPRDALQAGKRLAVRDRSLLDMARV